MAESPQSRQRRLIQNEIFEHVGNQLLHWLKIGFSLIAVCVAVVGVWGFNSVSGIKKGMEETAARLTQDLENKAKTTTDAFGELEKRRQKIQDQLDQLSLRAHQMSGVLNGAEKVVAQVDSLQKQLNQVKTSVAAVENAVLPADPDAISTFIGGTPLSIKTKRPNDIYVALFLSMEAQYKNSPSAEDLKAIREVLRQNGFTPFEGGYALKKNKSVFTFHPSTLRPPGIEYLRPELKSAAQKVQSLLGRWVKVPEQNVYFTNVDTLLNEGSNIWFKDFVRLSGIDIEIEF
jgi:uncharacterized protein YoxC